MNGALFAWGLVDELHLTICPWIAGGSRAPTIADGAAAASLASLKSFALISRRRLGNELFLVFRRQ